jgi:hypothetical protein
VSVRTRPTTLVAALAAIGLLAAPLRADPASKAKVADALAANNAQSTGLMGFFQTLTSLPDLDLTGAEFQDVATSSGLMNGPARPIFSSVRHLSKTGSSVRIDMVGRTESKIIADGVERGNIRLDEHVSMTVAGSSLTDFSGVKVSSSSPWADLKTLTFTHQGDKNVAVITVKWTIFTKTITIPIKKKAPPPVASAPTPTPTPTPTPAPNPAPPATTDKPATTTTSTAAPTPAPAPTPTPTPDPTPQPTPTPDPAPQGSPTDGFLPALGKKT